MRTYITAVCMITVLNAYGQPGKGSIFLSSDQGETWTQKDNGLPAGVAINNWVFHDNAIIAGTESHGVYISVDKLQSWQPSSKGLHDTKVDALAVFRNTVLAGTYRHGIFVSLDNGETWKPSNEGLTNLTIRTIYVHKGAIFAGTNGGIYASLTGGRSWTLVEGGAQVNTITSAGTFLYAGTHQGVLVSADGGKTWYAGGYHGALHTLTKNKNEITGITLNGEVITSYNQGLSWVKVLPFFYSTYTFRLTPVSPALLLEPWKDSFRIYTFPGFEPRGLPPASSFNKILSTPFGVVVAAGVSHGC